MLPYVSQGTKKIKYVDRFLSLVERVIDWVSSTVRVKTPLKPTFPIILIGSFRVSLVKFQI